MSDSQIRKEVIGDCTLYLGDCRKVLPGLGPVGAVVTDPPYGVLSEAWDAMSEAELAAFTMSWLGQVRTIAEMAVVFFGQKTRRTIQDLLYLIYPEIRQVIWAKGGGHIAEDGMFYSYESVYVCRARREPVEVVKPKSLEFARLLIAARKAAGLTNAQVDIAVRGKKTGLCYRWGEGACLPTVSQVEALQGLLEWSPDLASAFEQARSDRDVTVAANLARTTAEAARGLDVLTYPSPTGIDHPTSKPVPLMIDLCNLVGPGPILDPFAGSGSTLVACARLGRAGIGIESDPEYFELACRRVRDAYAQPDLFVPAPTGPVQEGMNL